MLEETCELALEFRNDGREVKVQSAQALLCLYLFLLARPDLRLQFAHLLGIDRRGIIEGLAEIIALLA